MGKKKKVTYNYSSEQEAQQVSNTSVARTDIKMSLDRDHSPHTSPAVTNSVADQHVYLHYCRPLPLRTFCLAVPLSANSSLMMLAPALLT
jgi:hypothetical protein